MERKLIQLANKTLVVSIPKEWAQQYGYKKGDTVDLLNKKGQFLITRSAEKRIPLIDVSTLPRRFVKRAISAIYKTGISPCDVRAGQYRTLVITEASSYFGLMVDESKEILRLKNIASPEEEDFDSSFRKVLMQLELLSKAVAQGEETKELLEQMHKNVKLCLWLLSAKTTKSIAEINNLHYILSSITTIAYAYEHIQEQKKNERTNARPLLDFLVVMIHHFRTYLTKEDALQEMYRFREQFLQFKEQQRPTTANAYAILIARILRDCAESAYTLRLINAHYY
jgi:bifunctional DNA-binding transcriptional regulator/antitoxin component of YhaV-PrlF toxin-antitoxin module